MKKNFAPLGHNIGCNILAMSFSSRPLHLQLDRIGGLEYAVLFPFRLVGGLYRGGSIAVDIEPYGSVVNFPTRSVIILFDFTLKKVCEIFRPLSLVAVQQMLSYLRSDFFNCVYNIYFENSKEEEKKEETRYCVSESFVPI